MERVGSGPRMDVARAVEREQRRRVVVRAVVAATLDVVAEERGDPRAVGNEPALAELAAAHDQQIAIGVDVAEPQSADLAAAQPESVAEREDRPVGDASLRRPGVVR